MREVTECIVHVINQQQPPPIEQCASASYAKRFYPSYRISPHKWSHYRFSNLNERRLVRALPITLQTLLERATLNMYRVIMTIEPGKRNTAFKRCRSFVHGLINVIGHFRGKNLIPLLLDSNGCDLFNESEIGRILSVVVFFYFEGNSKESNTAARNRFSSRKRMRSHALRGYIYRERRKSKDFFVAPIKLTTAIERHRWH